MKNTIKLALLLLLASPCFASISEITAAECVATAAASCTLGTHKLDDLEVTFAYRSASSTAPSLPAGYTSIATGGTSNSTRTAYRFLNGSETTTGTFTNATSVTALVFRGADITSTGPIGGNALGGATSAVVSYTTLTMTRTDGTSWVVGFDGCASCTAGNNAPSGMTLREGGAANKIAASSTAGGVASWPTTTVTVTTSGLWRSQTVEILAATARTSPTLIQAYHSGHTLLPCTSPCTYTIGLPNTVLSSNLQRLIFSVCGGTVAGTCVSTPPAISSITDNSGNTWVADASEVNATDFVTTKGYHVCGSTAGVSSIVVTFASGNIVDFQYDYAEYSGINTTPASCTDGNAGALVTGPGGSTATNMTAGAVGGTAGDLVDSYCAYVSNDIGSGDKGSAAADGIWPAGGNSVSVFRDTSEYVGYQAFFQTPASTVSPYFQMFTGNAQNFNCVAAAFKASGGAGTASPSGIRVPKVMYVHSTGLAAQPVFWDGTGNAIVIGSSNISQDITATSDTAGDTYTLANAANTRPSYSYSCSVTPASQIVKVTSGTLVSQWFSVYDIVGAKTGSSTSCFDKTVVASGSQLATATATNVSLTTNVVTVTASNAFATGQLLNMSACGTATYLNGQILTVASASGTQFTANFTHANDTSHSDTCKATPSVADAPDVTPTTSNGLVIVINGFGTGPAPNVSPGNFHAVSFAGDSDADKTSNGDGWGIYYNPNTTTENWTWTMANGSGGSSWDAVALLLEANTVNANASISESFQSSPSVVASAGRSASEADSATTSPAIATIFGRSKSISESFSSSPAVGTLIGRNIAIADSSTNADTLSAVAAHNATPAVTITTAPAVATTVGKNISESITSSPSVAGLAAHNAAISESVTSSPAVVASAGRSTALAVTFTTSPAVAAKLGSGRSVAESFTTADAIASLIARNVSIAESLTTAPAILTTAAYNKLLSESFTTTPSIGIQKGLSSLLAESITSSPFLTLDIINNSNGGNSVTTVPAIQTTVGRSVPLSQTITTSVVVATLSGKGAAIAQSVTIADSVGISVHRNQARRVVVIS